MKYLIEPMVKLANILYKGDGIPINKKESPKYYKLASEKGHLISMFCYAYMNDIGVSNFFDKFFNFHFTFNIKFYRIYSLIFLLEFFQC